MANDTFIEERSLGLQIDQVPVVFDERSRRAFVVSNKFVLVFNPQTGKREEILRHDNTVVGCYYREGKLNTFTAVGEYCVWDPESGKLQFCKQLNLSSIAFVHTVEGGSDESTMVFVLGAEEGSTVQKVYRCSAELSDEDGDFSFECVFAPVPLPQSRRHIAFGKDFVVICRGKIVEMSPLFGSAKKAARYELLQEFERIVDNSKVVWNGVAVHGDAVYVTLNIGRVYVWRHVASAGLTGKNRSFFHPGQTEIVQAVSAQHTVFCGTGECSVARYGFVVEGAGRWQSATKLSGLQASVTAIWLSTDECVLAVVLENTRLLFVKTSTMTVLASAEQILWPIEKTLALKSDPLRPDMLVSNARPGVVQWIKPSEWKTKEELDVCEANVPNRVHVLYNEFHSWSEVSVCCLTTDMIVTVERQNNEDRTCTAKFWRRSIVKDVDGESFKVRLEDSFDFDEDLIVSVRGDEDVDAKNFVCKLKPLYNQEHTDEIFIGLDNKGYFYIFKADPERFGGWCYDRLHRTNWQKSSVVHQSSLRSNIFASINHLANSPDSTYLLLWNVDNDRLRVEHVEDSIANLKSVEWAPSGNETTFRYLLYASDHVIGSYDIEALCSMWTVACSGSSLFVTPSLCLAGNNSEYCIFDPEDGRKINAAKFSSDQKIVLATGDLSHYDFVGYDKEEMTVLRNASKKSETTVNPLKKKTPFSDLVEINTNEQASEETFALEATVANKLFDGAAPSLAPVTYLAPLFIRSCLIK
ncbi:hypothetical protein L596_007206 [Steinernema carpocapsae]|uniref:Uncharacterized protein n=1 Tax=Steinernema carpocapsae TaxID=34508 RepID=A0A4U5P8J9_STECR|nr:hypothetical protein L596_007206 [Steinernema carpocapsae]